MVLIMYESEDIGVLQPVDNDTLQQKLAALIINKTPVRNHVVEKRRYTGIPLAYYDNVIRAPFLESWKFWKHGNHGGSTTYHGAPHDTIYINQTPFKDNTNWTRCRRMLGTSVTPLTSSYEGLVSQRDMLSRPPHTWNKPLKRIPSRCSKCIGRLREMGVTISSSLKGTRTITTSRVK